jgi:hypothetical protein
MPLFLIMNIQVVYKITHIPRKNQMNGLLIMYIGKKEINIIYSLFLEEMI